jgi:uncharacterized protein YifE (UPF0438 family)
MGAPSDHANYLSLHNFPVNCPGAFSDEERDILVRYGRWMEALASGAIAPSTPRQQEFLQVARGERPAETPFERAWQKWRDDRLARTLGAPAPTSSPPLPAGETTAPADVQQALACLTAAKEEADALRQRLEAERAKIMATVEAELAALEARYGQPLEEANREVAEREAELKAQVLRLGGSARNDRVQAVYYRGRVTWDSKGLAQYAQANPELERFRRVGPPTVVVRYRSAGG